MQLQTPGFLLMGYVSDCVGDKGQAFGGISMGIIKCAPIYTPMYPKMSTNHTGLIRTIKNPLSLVTCGFLYSFALLGIFVWYRGSESNRH